MAGKKEFTQDVRQEMKEFTQDVKQEIEEITVDLGQGNGRVYSGFKAGK